MKLTIEHENGERILIELQEETDFTQTVEQGVLPALNWYFGWDVKERLKELLEEDQ